MEPRITAAIALALHLAACSQPASLTTARHENGFAIAYDAGFWEIATLSDGFLLRQKGVLRNPRAAIVTWARQGRVDRLVQTLPGGSGGEVHNIQTGKQCPSGVALLNASYQSEDAPEFGRELKLLENAICPTSR